METSTSTISGDSTENTSTGTSTARVAQPLQINGVILDGAEDSQVVVMDDNYITECVMNQSCWRDYFTISSQHNTTAVGSTRSTGNVSFGLEEN